MATRDGGADPETNFKLRLAVLKARENSMLEKTSNELSREALASWRGSPAGANAGRLWTWRNSYSGRDIE